MAKTSEAALTARFRREIESIGGTLIVIPGNMRQSGWPDRVLYHRWWRGLVEIKVKNNKCSALQRATIRKLRAHDPCGCYVLRLALGPGGLEYVLEDENNDELAHIDGESGVKGLLGWLAAEQLVSRRVRRDGPP